MKEPWITRNARSNTQLTSNERKFYFNNAAEISHDAACYSLLFDSDIACPNCKPKLKSGYSIGKKGCTKKQNLGVFLREIHVSKGRIWSMFPKLK